MAVYGFDEGKNKVQVYDKDAMDQTIQSINNSLGGASQAIGALQQTVANQGNAIQNLGLEMDTKLSTAKIKCVAAGATTITVGAGLTQSVAIQDPTVTKNGTCILDVVGIADATVSRHDISKVDTSTGGVWVTTSDGAIQFNIHNAASIDWTYDLTQYLIWYLTP